MVEIGAEDLREDRIGKIISMYRKFAREVLLTAREGNGNAVVLIPQKVLGASQRQFEASTYS
jgi:hypothetical protein